ncbi:MAG TPA: hypothetical protein VHP37_29945 [Burkholderiales bacterium]|nr:hypothetical protein [Burkholderiales bacterium]
MDVESPEHLERLRGQPEVKAAALRFGPDSAAEVRFERASRNALYWPPIQGVLDRIASTGCVAPLQQECVVYGRPCWLLATSLASSPQAPFAVAVVSADGAPVEVLLELLKRVSYDYWFGSHFFK